MNKDEKRRQQAAEMLGLAYQGYTKSAFIPLGEESMRLSGWGSSERREHQSLGDGGFRRRQLGGSTK